MGDGVITGVSPVVDTAVETTVLVVETTVAVGTTVTD